MSKQTTIIDLSQACRYGWWRLYCSVLEPISAMLFGKMPALVEEEMTRHKLGY
jgi:uncharacterized membrane protein YsdA (DUF1294 family)